MCVRERELHILAQSKSRERKRERRGERRREEETREIGIEGGRSAKFQVLSLPRRRARNHAVPAERHTFVTANIESKVAGKGKDTSSLN